MRKKNTIRIAMLMTVLIGAFIVLHSAASIRQDKPSKESMDQCCKKKNSGNTNKAAWENLSLQFFSSL
ncbi:MAG: hypothetical protein Q8941_13145 [Bacteroidota bacterium]|nr:hypothetical protein [Bacteroidota bacterium]